MKAPVSWHELKSDGQARTGTMVTPHGDVDTPNFMAVGTRGTVKGVDREDLKTVGAQIVLANTYHLMLRPGETVVGELGELNGFMAWDGPILTDSGGYQVLSLKPKISEHDLLFRSTYDGSPVRLTPERAVEVQETLGSDIAMVLDEPVHLPSSREQTKNAMERTLRWAERSKSAKKRSDRALFGIVQGGAEVDLRATSAAETADIGFPGFGIGGLAVGESASERSAAISAVLPELPVDAVRYVMGLGDTEGLLDAVALGVDLFDCVLPTRVARHGKALLRTGNLSMKRAEWANDISPIDENCPCVACLHYSKGHIRHLVVTKELLAHRLLTLHNLTYTYQLMADIRKHISNGTFHDFRSDTVELRQQRLGNIRG